MIKLNMILIDNNTHGSFFTHSFAKTSFVQSTLFHVHLRVRCYQTFLSCHHTFNDLLFFCFNALDNTIPIEYDSAAQNWQLIVSCRALLTDIL